MVTPSAAPAGAVLAEVMTLIERNFLPDAAALLRGLLRREPANVQALCLAALTARLDGRPADAGTLLERAASLAPVDPIPLRMLAGVRLDEDRATEAYELLVRADTLEPGDAPTKASLGESLVRLGRLDEAAAAFEAAIELDPDAAHPRKGALMLGLAAGRPDAALEQYRALLALDGQEPAEHVVATGPFRSVREWCREHGSPYTPLSAAAPDTIQPPHFFGEPVPDPVPALRPETYVAEIPDAYVIGAESLVVTAAGELLLDLATMPGAERFDLAERVIRYAEDGIGLVDAPIVGTPIPAAIQLTAVSTHNYYHVLIDALPRLANVEAAADPELGRLPLIVDEALLATPQCAEALRSIVGDTRAIIPIPPGTARKVERLVVASPLAWLPNNLRDDVAFQPADVHVSAQAVAFLRERLGPPDRPGRGSRQLCIVKPSSARLENGNALVRIASAAGFEPVRPELLTLAEQAALFSEARAIVAETGAALTNLVFAPPGTRVVVLVGDRWQWTYFSQIAALLGHEMVFVPGSVTARHVKEYQSRFRLDPARLRAALRWASGEDGTR